MFGWVVAYVAVTSATRIVELVISRRNLDRSRTAESREFGRGHFPLFVALHVLLPVGLLAEATFTAIQPPAFWPLLLAVWIGAQALRIWCIRALGSAWNVRVWVTPGMRIVRSGPYRWLKHPNYVAVAVDLIAGPLMLGAWRTMIAASLINAVALALRLRAENTALATVANAAERRS